MALILIVRFRPWLAIFSSQYLDGEKRDRAYSMLLLYEFEALAKLGRSSELDQLLKQVLSSPDYDIKTIETLAGQYVHILCR